MLCPRCGYEAEPVVVHGHSQCELCHSIIDDCCQGLCAQQFISADQFNNKAQKTIRVTCDAVEK